MNACSFRAPNGENSLLYAALEQLVGPTKALQLYNEVLSEEFKARHGDWTEDRSTVPLDNNGEPILNWVQQRLQEDEDVSQFFMDELVAEYPEEQALQWPDKANATVHTVSVTDDKIPNFPKISVSGPEISIVNLSGYGMDQGAVVLPSTRKKNRHTVFVKEGSPAFFKYLPQIDKNNIYRVKRTNYYFLSNNVSIETIYEREKRLLKEKTAADLRKKGQFRLNTSVDVDRSVKKSITDLKKRVQELSKLLETHSKEIDQFVQNSAIRMEERNKAKEQLYEKIEHEYKEIEKNKDELIEYYVQQYARYYRDADTKTLTALLSNLPIKVLANIIIEFENMPENEKGYYRPELVEENLFDPMLEYDTPLTDELKKIDIRSSTNAVLTKVLESFEFTDYLKRSLEKAVKKVNQKMEEGTLSSYISKEELNRILFIQDRLKGRNLTMFNNYLAKISGKKTKLLAVMLEMNTLNASTVFTEYVKQANSLRADIKYTIETAGKNRKLVAEKNAGLNKIFELQGLFSDFNKFVRKENAEELKLVRNVGRIFLNTTGAGIYDMFHEIGHFIYDIGNRFESHHIINERIKELEKSSPAFQAYVNRIKEVYGKHGMPDTDLPHELFAHVYSAVITQQGELYDILKNTPATEDSESFGSMFREFLEYFVELFKSVFNNKAEEFKALFDELYTQIDKAPQASISVNQQLLELKLYKEQYLDIQKETEEIRKNLTAQGLLSNDGNVLIELPNGEKQSSKLFEHLQEHFSDDQALDIYLMTHTKNFKAFMKGVDPAFLNSQGEPMLFMHGTGTAYYEVNKKFFLGGEGAMAYGAGIYITNEPETAKSYSSGVSKKKGNLKYKQLFAKVFNPRFQNRDNNPFIHEMFINPRNPLFLDGPLSENVKRIVAEKLSEYVVLDPSVAENEMIVHKGKIVHLNPEVTGETLYRAVMYAVEYKDYEADVEPFYLETRELPYIGSSTNIEASEVLFNAGIEANYRYAGGATNAFGGQHRKGEMHVIVYDSNPIKSINNIGTFNRKDPNKYFSLDMDSNKTVYTADQILKNNGFNTTEEAILEKLYKIYDEASANPEKIYEINFPDNMKEKIWLQGKKSITVLQLAIMADNRPIPFNVKFSDGFEAVLQNTPRRYLGNIMYQDNHQYEPLEYTPEMAMKQMEENFVAVRDANGNKTGGFFSSQHQTEVVDSIVHFIYQSMKEDEKLKRKRSIGTYKEDIKTRGFGSRYAKYKRVAAGEDVPGFEGVTKERAAKLAEEFEKVLNSFDTTDGLSFWKAALQRLKDLRIRIKGDGFEVKSPDEVNPGELEDGTLISADGEGLSDWSDSHFEHNFRDTATGRLTMFLATIPDSEIGEQDRPKKEASIAFTNNDTRKKIINGQKKYTIRTTEQAKTLKLSAPGSWSIFTVSLEKGGKKHTYKITALRPANAQDVEVLKKRIADEEGVEMKEGDMLYRIEPYIPEPNVIRSKKSYLGMPKLVNFEQLFGDMVRKLAGQERSFENYIRILQEEGKKYNPNLLALADRLKAAPTDLQNEFVSVVTLQYQPFTMVLLDKKKDKSGKEYFSLKAIDANRNSQLNVIRDTWRQNQKFSPILTTNDAGLVVIDRTKAAELKADLDKVELAFESKDSQAIKKGLELVKKLFEYNGITMPDKAYLSLAYETEKWTKDTTVAGGFRRQFAIGTKGEPLGIFSSMILKLSGVENAYDGKSDEEDQSYALNNPLYTEGTSLGILTRVAAAHTSVLYSDTHRSSEGKTIYDFGFNSTLSNNFRKLQQSEAYRNKFADTDIARNSFLLNRLKNDANMLGSMSLHYLDGLRNASSPLSSGTVRPDMSDREQLLTAIALFQNKGNRYAHYLSLTHSDKTTTPVFMNMPRITITTTKTVGNLVSTAISDEAMTEMFNVFYSEYDRKMRVEEALKQGKGYNNPQYEKGARHFFFLPQFNYDQAKKTMTKSDLERIYFDNGTMKPKDAPGFKEAVRNVLTSYINDLSGNTKNLWRENGIITADSTPFDPYYINRLLGKIGISFYESVPGKPELKNVYFGRDGKQYTDTEIARIAATLAAQDFAVNSFLMNVSMSQIFYGDPAQVWKGSVEKTMTEYGKRLAKDIAPGREGNFAAGETYVTITAKDFTTSAPYLSEVEELRKDYGETGSINASDAQELVTVQEHLDVLKAYGRISETTHKEMTDIINAADGGFYEFKEQHHLDVIMQPMKPVYVSDRPVQDGAILHDYVKSSAYPLYPPFLVDKELDKLRKAMEGSGVARFIFESSKKIGIPSNPVKVFRENGTVDESVFQSPDWTGMKDGHPVPSARQVLYRSGFRIQQEIPYEADKSSIRTVSQMNKLITHGIAQIRTDFMYDGLPHTGEDLMNIKDSIRKDLMKINQEKLFKEIGATIDGDGNLIFKERSKLFAALRKRVLEGSANFSTNDLAYLQEANFMANNSDELVIPLMFAPSAAKFESLITSLVSEIANIKMPGRSYVQASPAGHQSIGKWEDLTEEQRSKIVTVEGYDGNALKTARIENGVVEPAQVLVPFSFLFKNGKAADISKFTRITEDERTVIDHDKIPKELLQLVAARIPNQKHSSMLPVQIVGFVPDNMGDLMIVPAAITKQMGSDFDVDKIYAYRRAYRYEEGAFVEETDISSEEGLKNAYFDVHWAVLTHPEMLPRVLATLDKPDLKEEAEQIQKWTSKADAKPVYFYDPVFQLSDFLSQKDAKQLVGQSSLSVTFEAVIQNKDIFPGKIGFSPEEGEVKSPVSIVILDENGIRRELNMLSGYGISWYKGDKRTKQDNLTSMQSEFVDYAKNRISDKVHLNKYTYPAAAALIQLQTSDMNGEDSIKLLGEENGWAPNLQWVTRLMSQPIIKEYAKIMAKSEDSLSGYNPHLKKELIKSLKERYAEKFEVEEETDMEENPLSFEDLTEALKKGETAENFGLIQIAAINLFETLDTIGGELARAQSTINHDTKGVGATVMDMISKEVTRDKLLSPIGRDIALLNVEQLYNGTEQGRLFDILHATTDMVTKDLFPYRELWPLFEYIMEQTNRHDLTVKMQKIVFDAMKSYLFSHPRLGLWENPEATRVTLLYGREGKPSLAERVQQAKMTWGQTNYLLQHLQTEIDPNKAGPSEVFYLASKASNMDEHENTRAWMEMLQSEDPEIRLLGEDLIRYNYLTGGIQDARSFLKFIPYSFMLGTDFGIRLRELSSNLQNIVLKSNFRTQVFQHNPQIAVSLSPTLKELGGLEDYLEEFELPAINPEYKGATDPHNPASNLIIRAKKPGIGWTFMYPDYLSYFSVKENKWILYEKEKGNHYKRIDLLGNKVTNEYSYTEGKARRSIIPQNRAKAYDNISPAFKSISMMPLRSAMEEIEKDLNMPQSGGAKEVEEVLRSIEKDTKIPNYLRVISKFLADTSFDTLSLEALPVLGGTIPSLNFKVVSGEEGEALGAGAAQYNNISREILIRADAMYSKTHFAEALNHELIHDRTAWVALMAESTEDLKQQGYTPEQITWLKSAWEVLVTRNPEVRTLMTRLTELRSEARIALRKEMEKNGHDYDTVLDQITGDEESGRAPKYTNPWALHVYAMNSNKEFITHVLTSVPIMQFLNRHESVSQKGNFLSKFVDVLRSLLAAIGTALGVSIERNSILDYSLRTALELATINKSGIQSVASLSDPSFMINFNSKSHHIVNPTLTAIERMIGKLQEQRRELIDGLTGKLSKEEYAERRSKIDRIETDIKALEADGDFTLIGQIGTEQLNWVENVLKIDSPTASQIMTASRILETWPNLISIVYDKTSTEDVDPVFADLQARAQKMRGNLTAKMEELIIKTSNGVLRAKDFEGQQLRDTDWINTRIRGMSSAAGALVTQYIATYMETVARHRDEDQVKLIKWGDSMREKMKKHGKLQDVYNMFLQTNASGTAFGLVQRFSQNWYDEVRSWRAARQAELNMIDKSKRTPKDKSKLKQDAWKKYWAKVNQNAIYADTRLLFDTDTGALKTDAAALAHRAELEAEVGAEGVQELIDEAQERYMKYLERKQAHSDLLDSQVAAGTKSDTDASIEKAEFVHRYSPNVFFNNFKNPLATFKDINTDYYAKMIPRRSVKNGAYYDSQFETIHNNKELSQIYQEYKTKLEEFRNMLPVYVQSELSGNFLPVVHQDLLREFMNIPGYVKNLDQNLIKGLTASKWEQDQNEKKYPAIPIDYVEADSVELESRSKDLIGILEVFGSMALHYRHFSEAKNFIEMGEAVLKEHDISRTQGATQQVDVNGKVTTVRDGLTNTLAGLEYMKEYLMYKKARKLEAKGGKLYSVLNPVKNYKITQEIKGMMEELKKLDDDLVDGVINSDEYNDRKKAIEDKLAQPRYRGREFYGSKLGDRLIHFNQLKALSYNPFSAVANVLFGLISAQIHANGKRDFTRKELMAAYRSISHSSLNWWSAGTIETAEARKMLAIMDRMGIIGDYVDSNYGTFKVRDRKRGWLKRLSPYHLLRSGDYFMKAVTTRAMLIHDKVKVTENGEVKEIALWEALNEDGEWNAEKYGENKEWSSEETQDQVAWDKFRNKAIRVNMVIHGNTDKNSPKLMNKFILGRLLGQFRSSWLPEGWNSRFQAEHMDIQLGRVVKGRYRTYANLGLAGTWHVVSRQLLSTLMKVDPYKGVNMLNGQPISEVDIENMRRNFSELAFILGFAAMIAMLKALMEDDDDKKAALQLVTNMAVRAQQDLWFYASPTVFENITRDIIPATRVISDGWKAVKAVTRYMTDDEYESAQMWRAIFRAGLPIPQFTLVPKTEYMLNRDLRDLQR